MTDHDERRTPLPGENRQGWMMFRHGGPLQLLELTPEQVDVRDIIHGLGQINRFNGQSARPIPVLWHSLMVMQLCAAHDPATRLEALFHDAAETYVGDWIRPLRGVLGDRLLQLRETIQETVFEAVGLPGRSAKLSPPVHHADNLMLRCEMESPWGYGRIVSWYEPPSDAERSAVQDATTEIGCPPANALDRERMQALFLEHANRLAGAGAPIRASIETADRSRSASRATVAALLNAV